jgi:hypothetical protein
MHDMQLNQGPTRPCRRSVSWCVCVWEGGGAQSRGGGALTALVKQTFITAVNTPPFLKGQGEGCRGFMGGSECAHVCVRKADTGSCCR